MKYALMTDEELNIYFSLPSWLQPKVDRVEIQHKKLVVLFANGHTLDTRLRKTISKEFLAACTLMCDLRPRDGGDP